MKYIYFTIVYEYSLVQLFSPSSTDAIKNPSSHELQSFHPLKAIFKGYDKATMSTDLPPPSDRFGRLHKWALIVSHP